MIFFIFIENNVQNPNDNNFNENYNGITASITESVPILKSTLSYHFPVISAASGNTFILI